MVLGVLSTALFFPFGPSEATGKIVDPLNPSVIVQPITEAGEGNGISKKSSRKKKADNAPVAKKGDVKKTAPTESSDVKARESMGSRQSNPIHKKRKKTSFDKHFFSHDSNYSEKQGVASNGNDFESQTFLADVLGACAGNILYAKR